MKWVFDEEEEEVEEDKRPKWEKGDPVLYWPLNKYGDKETEIELPDEMEIVDTNVSDEEEAESEEDAEREEGEGLEGDIIDMDDFDADGYSDGDAGSEGAEGADAE